jgi:hypothetical protein
MSSVEWRQPELHESLERASPGDRYRRRVDDRQVLGGGIQRSLEPESTRRT